jgi:hypothetical protein
MLKEINGDGSFEEVFERIRVAIQEAESAH